VLFAAICSSFTVLTVTPPDTLVIFNLSVSTLHGGFELTTVQVFSNIYQRLTAKLV